MATWYNHKEFRSIRRDVTASCKAIESGSVLKDSDVFSARGLDRHIDPKVTGRQKLMSSARATVLEGIQKNESESAIAKQYEEASFPAWLKARHQGLKDELAALAMQDKQLSE